MPAMINLQQYYLEEALVEACLRNPLVDLRWKHQLMALRQEDDQAVLRVRTPDGAFEMHADWVIACDGANSDTRAMVGAGFTGRFFEDRFLIADVVMAQAPARDTAGSDGAASGESAGVAFPTERWFWFDPPFHRGQSVLLHRQCDNVWRIDFQLGADADPTEEKSPARVVPRIQAMLGPRARFELEWVSIYQFACRRIDRFRYGRVLFAGDAAHQVSPFGARGANSGVHDIDNLVWKLQMVIVGTAGEALIDSYHEERAFAADDNLLASTRSTDFITPKSRASRRFRDAVLELAEHHAFARPLVNSGRLSTPSAYVGSSLNSADVDVFAAAMRPGSACADAPIRHRGAAGWLLPHFGDGFVALCFGDRPDPTAFELLAAWTRPAASGGAGLRLLCVGADASADLVDCEGLVGQRYDARAGTVYLIRPDQHVAARWRRFDAAAVAAALAKAIATPVAVTV
jgi:3-(3-hydroxy-phenyl)propionate hydroxylase